MVMSLVLYLFDKTILFNPHRAFIRTNRIVARGYLTRVKGSAFKSRLNRRFLNKSLHICRHLAMRSRSGSS